MERLVTRHLNALKCNKRMGRVRTGRIFTAKVEEENKLAYLEDGEALIMRRVLLKPKKEQKEPIKRRSLFKTICNARGKCCIVIVDNDSMNNLVSQEMVEKLSLEKIKHPNPYKVMWLKKGHQLLVNEQCLVSFSIKNYKDEIMCDVMPMDACHILLGRSWQYD